MTQLADLRWMLPPLAMCLVLTGIHGYLGIHVLSRKVIFVDLALAQIAALGSTYAVLLGYDPRLPGDGAVVYLFSLGFTIVGAAVFSLSRMRHDKVPQEAFIGIVYAMASALALLLLAKSAGEAEHIKQMLVGNILLVTWPTVAKTTAIYAVLGGFHYLFRKPFLEISTDAAAAAASGRRVRWWDFFFYASFGLVITSSVAVAGVLLVFSFLVVPAVIAFMYQDVTTRRVILAWTVGTVCSAAGMLLSYYGDLPTGPSVVSCFAAMMMLASAWYFVRGAQNRHQAWTKIVVGAAAMAGLAVLSLKFQKTSAVEHAHDSEFATLAATVAAPGPDENAVIEAVHHLGTLRDPHAVPLLIAALQRNESDRVAEHIIEVLPVFGSAATEAVPALEETARRASDPFLKLAVADTLLRLRSPAGLTIVASLLGDGASPLMEQKAGDLVTKAVGHDFGIKDSAGADRRVAVANFKSWVAQKGHRLKWRQDRLLFE